MIPTMQKDTDYGFPNIFCGAYFLVQTIPMLIAQVKGINIIWDIS